VRSAVKHENDMHDKSHDINTLRASLRDIRTWISA